MGLRIGRRQSLRSGVASSSASLAAAAHMLTLPLFPMRASPCCHSCPGPAANADVAIFGAATNAATSRRQVLADYASWADSMIGHWRVEEDGHKSPNVRVAGLLLTPLLLPHAGAIRLLLLLLLPGCCCEAAAAAAWLPS